LSYEDPSEYKPEAITYEYKPTGGIQAIAEKPFTPCKVEKFNSKAGEQLCIIETVETFDGIEYKLENSDEKTTGKVNRFFASPRDIKAYFTDDKIMTAINEDGFRPTTMIEKVPFNAEEVKRSAGLKGKTHYVFKKVEKSTAQESL
jgi:hypothetical protein